MKNRSRKGSESDAIDIALVGFGISAVMLLIIIPIILSISSESKTNLIKTTTEFGNGEIISQKGEYSLFRTNSIQEYLNFLDNFDDDKFEIVDISTSYHVLSDGSDEFYMVTYKAKG